MADTKNMVEGVDYILDKKGRKVHPKTKKQLKGFALHPEKQNKGGRPKGALSKDATKEAIQRFKANRLHAAQLIIDIMNGDEEKLGKEIKIGERMGAAKYVIQAPTQLETELEDNNKPVESTEEIIEKEDNKVVPLVQLRQ
jgi:ribosome-binding ATPase YchF (GTP1/OBG family)